MSTPILFHDPTSEPSRAVHWLALEAGVEVDIRYLWLTRDEHRRPELLRVNPGHQVPAMEHAGFCLAEASAIMLYLTDLHAVQGTWLGATVEDRAWTNRFLSWHHANPRRTITLDYFLPVLLMPAYRGVVPPPAEERRRRFERGRESLALLEVLLAERGDYLGGRAPSLADLFIAPDLFALDLDPDRAAWFDGLPRVSEWLLRLRDRRGYQVSHAPWNAIVPRLKKLLTTADGAPRDGLWVADACAPHLVAQTR